MRSADAAHPLAARPVADHWSNSPFDDDQHVLALVRR